MTKLNVMHRVAVISICFAISNLAHAAPGSILSYFSAGESHVWGLEMKEVEGSEGGGTSQLHAMVAGAQVQRFDVTTASGVKDGSLSAYDSKTQMMRADVSAYPSLGLAIIPTYVGPYGVTYSSNFSMGDGRTTQSIWGEATFYGNPGNLQWAVINGQPDAGINGFWNEGDLCGVYRTYTLDQPLSCWTTWSTASALAPTPYGIYRYQMNPWGLRDSYDKLLVMPKAIYGVSLGAGCDLYVLCQDREILHVSDSTGDILDRFYLDSAITHPFGITYDVSENSLWISDYGTNNIYQISCATLQGGWSINSSNALDPLLYTYGGQTLHLLKNVGPVFVGGIAPEDYSSQVISSTVVDGYTVLECQASYGALSSNYFLKFKELPDHSMELLAEGGNEVEEFRCGRIEGTLESFKQFYTGQRLTEAFPGNYGESPHVYWPSKGLYFYAYFDVDWSNSETFTHRYNPKSYFLMQYPPVGCDSKYAVLTNGTRWPLKERYVIRASKNMWDTLGPVQNIPSEYRQELSTMLFFDSWQSGFTMGEFALKWLKDVVADRLRFNTIIQSWGSGGFDDANPDAYRNPDHNEPQVQFGTKKELQDFIALGKSVGRIGLRCNYMATGADSWSVSEGLVKPALNSSGEEQWYTNYHTVEPVAERQETEIHADFNTTSVFHDQWTSGCVLNYDASEPGAGKLSSNLQSVREICEFTKNMHSGPMGSESMFVEYLIGKYVDTGDFGIMGADQRFDISPEYKLRRLHQLTTFPGMGMGYRFFHGPWETNWIEDGYNDYYLSDDKLDSYRACQVLYGNGAYLSFQAYEKWGLRKVHALTECFTVGIAQRYYALQEVDYVKYGKADQWQMLDQIITSSSSLAGVQSWYKKFHIRYKNGCNVWVNRDTGNMAVTLPDSSIVTLPQNGWVVYTEDGNFVSYTSLYNSNRVDFCEDKSRGIKYVNPRQASSYMGVSRPTVWFNGKIYFTLQDPGETFLEAYRTARSPVPPSAVLGSILSYFDTGESERWGLEIDYSEIATQLHMQGKNGQVVRYVVTTAEMVKDGSESAYDKKFYMMATPLPPNLIRGLALVPSYQGPYGKWYGGNLTNGSMLRSPWSSKPGTLSWATINGAVDDGIYEPEQLNEFFADGDISAAARTYILDAPINIWTTWSTSWASAPTAYGIYLYPFTPWQPNTSYIRMFAMSKPLQGVSLGDANDLWVLCKDGEILHISDSDGSILSRFYLDSRIIQPWGIAYSPNSKSLWISSSLGYGHSATHIYQVCATGDVRSFSAADINKDFCTDFEDYAMMSAQWGSECFGDGCGDIDGQPGVDLQDLEVLASQWLTCSNPLN